MLADDAGEQVEAEALARSVVTEFENYVKLNKKISPEVVGAVQQIDDYAKLADTVASHLAVKIPDKQAILETADGRRAAGEGARPDGERNLACCRSRSASARASSARWRRPSASTTSTSR